MKRFSKVMAKVLAVVLVLGLMATPFYGTTTAKAANVSVDKYVNAVHKKNVSASKSFKTVAGGKVVFTAEYPTYKVTGDSAFAKKLNALIKKEAYTKMVKALKAREDVETGEKLTVGSTVDSAYQVGNVLVINLVTVSARKGGAYPTTTHQTISVNLTTGKLITLKKLFGTKLTKARAAVAKYIQTEIKKDKASYNPLKDIKNDIKNYWKMKDVAIDLRTMTVHFDEDVIGPHATGCVDFVIPEDIYFEFLSNAGSKLLFPLGLYTQEREENPGSTGYEWTVEYDKDYVELAVDRYFAPDVPEGFVGAAGTRLYGFYATGKKTGKTTITLKYARSWEASEDDKIEKIDIIVLEDGFITEDNGENG